uniref:Uncharacterized protein n=1 Tax=viral metagenome TaxID=1070528 RepID=A0A6C0JB61_9ZZZZ
MVGENRNFFMYQIWFWVFKLSINFFFKNKMRLVDMSLNEMKRLDRYKEIPRHYKKSSLNKHQLIKLMQFLGPKIPGTGLGRFMEEEDKKAGVRYTDLTSSKRNIVLRKAIQADGVQNVFGRLFELCKIYSANPNKEHYKNLFLRDYLYVKLITSS